MKALRWILFSLLAFALGTGAAFVLHPPTIGVPTATASGLSADLSKINDYAAQGRCDAVRGRLRGAAAKIDALPSRTATATVVQLTDALDRVRSEALDACQRVSDAQIAEQQAQDAQEQAEQATTPSTPTPTPEVTTTPDAGDEGITGGEGDGTDGGTTPGATDGGGDAGDGTGDGQGGPGQGGPGNGNGNGPGGGPGNGNGPGGNPGGVSIPGEGAIRQRLDQERRKWEREAEKIRKAWGQ